MRKSKHLLGALAATLFGTAAFAADGDILVADFNGKDYGAWRVEGEAFGDAPASGTTYQIVIDGKEIREIKSQGADVVSFD
ncbi:MAG: hypothetical protein IJO46_02960 [Thermoguttaceae bacterium]|nr:hypothetical protein [Thermoguttaceae bacterium]